MFMPSRGDMQPITSLLLKELVHKAFIAEATNKLLIILYRKIRRKITTRYIIVLDFFANVQVAK